ncbi:cupin domain-containing protein [Limibacillus halophilus]|uniref:Quercetin dioxygenase-like cupin family protein n=1 Tax=Limibacillus halophilus TaxID=1579333 RepID=A0A839SPZ1_9PROT|nr:cupin domain-containing protein [Limibacillus halophilus]MBB3064967.1 quercetin dioxygenase-like cupin family protein [Limibacillus halophilus]
MKIRAVHVKQALDELPVLKGRTPQTTASDADPSFATLATFGKNGGVFVGSFEGRSAWERHSLGDELVQVVAGSTRLTILADGQQQIFEMKAGMVTVVPQGCWHRFDAPEGVSVLTVTPQPTDHSADDPVLSGNVATDFPQTTK